MSRNGSGVYSLPAGNPVVTGTSISSTWANNTLSDIATALTGSVAADGQTAMSGNLQMGSNKITGLTAGTASTDAVNYGQLTGGTEAGVFTSVTDSGLTSGRVTYATTAGLLTDSANLTFNGTTLTANTLNLSNALTTAYGGTGLTSYTAGDLPYYATGTSLSKLGIGSSNYVMTSSGTAPQWSNALSISTLTLSSSLTLSGGTANGVLYLNGSKVATSGTALVFDGSNLGLGVTPSVWYSTTGVGKAIQIGAASALYDYSASGNHQTRLYNNGYLNTSAVDTYLTTDFASKYTQILGVHAWYTAPSGTAGNPITFTQAMTLDANNNLSIGTTTMGGNSTNRNITAYGSTSAVFQAQSSAVTVQLGAGGSEGYVQVNGAYPLEFIVNGSEQMRLDSVGNLGLGVVPSAWSGTKTLQLSTGAALSGDLSNFYQTANAYYDGTKWKYIGSSYAVQFNSSLGKFIWNTTASGTAGNTITWTQAMTLDASGNLTVNAGSLGYGTGSGGAVTQLTSRTTGVTLNKSNGAITLVSAAGSAAYQSFTVTNSTVAATDTIIVNQKSGTDIYETFVTAVAAGSFRITFATTGGTTTEQPVFNFAVIKAVTA